MFTKSIYKSSQYLIFCYMSGLSVTLSFAPYNIWPFAILAPMLLLLLWDNFPNNKLLSSVLFGCGYFSAGSWIFYSFKDHSDIGITTSIIASILFILTLALGFIVPHILTNKLPGSRTLRYLCFFPLSWIAMEYLRTKSQLAYPWLFIAYSQTSSPIINLSPYIGTFGTSYIVLILASSTYISLRKKSKPAILILGVLILSISTISVTQTYENHNKSLNTILIQNNNSEKDKWYDSGLVKIIREYEKIISKNIHTKSVVILPETAIPRIPFGGEKSITSIKETLQKNQATALLGTFTYNNNHVYNSIVTIGDKYSINSKRRLVAFGESTPDIPGIKELAVTFDFPMSNITPSTDSNLPINVNGVKVATFICYEIAFPDEVFNRGKDADILIVISDNIWFGTSIASYQHRQITQFYAKAMKKPTIFVNNSGLSSIISANGDIIRELPNNTKGFIDHNLYF